MATGQLIIRKRVVCYVDAEEEREPGHTQNCRQHSLFSFLSMNFFSSGGCTLGIVLC
jgi:hypothetical protein